MTESPADLPLVLVSGPDEDGVAVITLNRPEKKNALSIALREEVVALLGRMAGDEAVKALVITGSGGCFSAGFDLREFAVTDPGHIERLWRSSDQFHHAVHRFPLPVIAAVDGVAYAGGFDLAILCDLRIATHRATFAHPEAALGPVVYGPLHRRLRARHLLGDGAFRLCPGHPVLRSCRDDGLMKGSRRLPGAA
jgi:enoyl-CoA hydratase/carnithine racemase